MSTPDFSIATPTRNALDKLVRCIGSVRGQHQVAREHLVQDACSEDGTGVWLQAQAGAQEVAGAAAATLSWRSERDSGMYDAINRAWARSRGGILSWLNADEQYLPGTLARVGAFFAANPDCDVLYGDYIVADPAGRPVALRREIPFRRRYVTHGFLYAQSCTLFFRRRLFDAGTLMLDTNYRYAADMDLLLRLHDGGARIAHLPGYLSIFGIDGSNLSTHPRMLEETEHIRRRFDASGSRAVRALTLAGRRVERLVRGCYRRDDVQYLYATDEAPHYQRVHARAIGGRYALSDIEGRAERVEPVGMP